MPYDGWSLWFPMLGGGLAGSIFTLAGQKIGNWWVEPKLTAQFGKTVPGSTVKHDFSRPTDNRAVGTKHWTRVKIFNNGKSTARNVRVVIARIKNNSIQAQNWDFLHEVIDCNWSHIKDTRIDIPSKTWRFADILVVESIDGKDELRFTGSGANNIPRIAEQLSIEAIVTADNCKTRNCTVTLQYDGLGRGMSFL